MALTAERLDPIRWIVLPMGASMAGAVLFAAPIRVHGFQLPEPVFALIPVFAWAVVRPSLFAPLRLLALGLFYDLLWGGRLGLWPLALLAAYGFVLATRSMMIGQSRVMLWTWFAVTTLVAMAVAYIAVLMDVGVAPNMLAVAWQWLPTALLWPLADRLIGRFEDADPRFR
jgi:rod shape-determining protein MreD